MSTEEALCVREEYLAQKREFSFYLEEVLPFVLARLHEKIENNLRYLTDGPPRLPQTVFAADRDSGRPTSTSEQVVLCFHDQVSGTLTVDCHQILHGELKIHVKKWNRGDDVSAVLCCGSPFVLSQLMNVKNYLEMAKDEIQMLTNFATRVVFEDLQPLSRVVSRLASLLQRARDELLHRPEGGQRTNFLSNVYFPSSVTQGVVVDIYIERGNLMLACFCLRNLPQSQKREDGKTTSSISRMYGKREAYSTIFTAVGDDGNGIPSVVFVDGEPCQVQHVIRIPAPSYLVQTLLHGLWESHRDVAQCAASLSNLHMSTSS